MTPRIYFDTTVHHNHSTHTRSRQVHQQTPYFTTTVAGARSAAVSWSSMLPETVDVAQRLCRPVRQLNVSTDAVIEDVFDQCEDEIHAGPALRQRFVSKLVDIVCEVDGDRDPGHCRRGYSGIA